MIDGTKHVNGSLYIYRYRNRFCWPRRYFVLWQPDDFTDKPPWGVQVMTYFFTEDGARAFYDAENARVVGRGS
jgi:hypothetical protein